MYLTSLKPIAHKLTAIDEKPRQIKLVNNINKPIVQKRTTAAMMCATQKKLVCRRIEVYQMSKAKLLKRS